MKNIVLFINLISCILIIWSYDLYEVILKGTMTETQFVSCLLVCLLFFLINIFLYIKDQKTIIKYELLFINLLVNSYIGKIFIKIKYYESQWYDVIYSNNWFEIKRHYNTLEYRRALDEYIETKYKNKIKLFDEEIKSNLISNSKSIKELYTNVDKYQVENTPIDLSFFNKIFSVCTTFCVNHPYLVTTVITGIIGCIGISYYNIDKIQSAVSHIIKASTVQNNNNNHIIEIDKNLNQAIGILQQELVVANTKITKIADAAAELAQQVFQLAEKTNKIEKFFKMLIQKVVETNGNNNALNIENIIKQLTDAL